MTHFVRSLSLGSLLLLSFSACRCGGPGGEDGGPSGAGVVVARAVEGGFELSLEGLDAPLRALQVEVSLRGTRATRLAPAGEVEHDVLEAGLDEPKAELIAVIADTRRLLLTEGAVARIETEGGGEISLGEALAVDDEGRRRALAVEVR